MSRFWSTGVKNLQPYVPGEQPKGTNLIKLNTNENPYGPSPKVLQALQLEAKETLRLYPDPNAEALKGAIAEYFQLKIEQVFLGNGSDEVLAHVFQGLLKHEHPILFPDITYNFYPSYCKLYNIECQEIPLTHSFEINIDNYRRKNGGIIFPNPNALTGKFLSLDIIKRLLDNNKNSVIVIDEAYVDFGGETAIKLIRDFPNLLIVQTFSKSRSLAGLRVGFAVGNENLIEALERVKNSFNPYTLDRMAIKAAVAALQDHAYFNHTRQQIISTREFLAAQLQDLEFEVIPSKANFLLVRHPFLNAPDLCQQLRQTGIIVRYFPQDRIEQFLRISIGTNQDCNLLIKVLTDILERR